MYGALGSIPSTTKKKKNKAKTIPIPTVLKVEGEVEKKDSFYVRAAQVTWEASRIKSRRD
jgi:hypothetical protein